MSSRSNSDSFWLKVGYGQWTEVSKAEYVAAEREAEFRNTLGQPSEPATSSFSYTGPAFPDGIAGMWGFLMPQGEEYEC